MVIAEKAKQEIYVPAEATNEETFERDTIGMSETFLESASLSPELGLIQIARKIELEMKRLLAATGKLKGCKSISYPDMAEYLGKNGPVSKNLKESIHRFWDVRNKVVHKRPGSVRREDLIRAIDIGLTILSTITAIPHEKNVVAHPGVDLYKDPGCTFQITDARGLILETTSTDGVRKTFRVFPTTKTDYKARMAVSWEWDMGRIWGPTYYKDPKSFELKKAWSSSAEFIGRDLEAI